MKINFILNIRRQFLQTLLHQQAENQHADRIYYWGKPPGPTWTALADIPEGRITVWVRGGYATIESDRDRQLGLPARIVKLSRNIERLPVVSSRGRYTGESGSWRWGGPQGLGPVWRSHVVCWGGLFAGSNVCKQLIKLEQIPTINKQQEQDEGLPFLLLTGVF